MHMRYANSRVIMNNSSPVDQNHTCTKLLEKSIWNLRTYILFHWSPFCGLGVFCPSFHQSKIDKQLFTTQQTIRFRMTLTSLFSSVWRPLPRRWRLRPCPPLHCSSSWSCCPPSTCLPRTCRSSSRSTGWCKDLFVCLFSWQHKIYVSIKIFVTRIKI